MKYLLDTNICIYIIKNKFSSIISKIDGIGFDQIAISSITIAELEYGVANSSQIEKSKEALLQFLLPFEILDFTAESAMYYGKIRKELKKNLIGTMDMLIASIALSNNLIVVTNNEKEFNRISDLKIENWTK
jgi:tRNA(fMet)-specific endonuclease VapC